MIELPEAVNLARQLNDTVAGKVIKNVEAGRSPYKFAWFHDDPRNYQGILRGKAVDRASGIGGMVEVKAGDAIIVFSDGVSLRYYGKNDPRPQHGLLRAGPA